MEFSNLGKKSTIMGKNNSKKKSARKYRHSLTARKSIKLHGRVNLHIYVVGRPGIQRDKTMDDKLIYIHIDYIQNCPFCRL